ncbi:cytoplasmic protein [Falsibacillus pallidus]|uniref:cytoplasmic protein n=1 Tax=Falsibacillus pallidus TaxID=493781 RepID=UPI003D992F9B
MSGQNHVKITGSGSASGGSYDKITIRGEGTILHDVECQVFKTFGSSELQGDIRYEKLDVFGETNVKGAMQGTELKVIGQLTSGSDAAIHKTKVRGSLDLAGGIKGEKADIKGSISSGGNIEMEIFQLHGNFTAEGLLSAEVLDIGLRFGVSRAAEIGGSKISVKKKSALPFFPFGKGDGTLEVKIIEGDDISIENTRADIVRGRNVTVGSGCEIGLVEYSESFKHTSNSTIKEKKKY